MTEPKAQTEDDTRLARYEALVRELGPDGFIDYIQQISRGKGDYTAERQQPDTLAFEKIQEMLATIPSPITHCRRKSKTPR